MERALRAPPAMAPLCPWSLPPLCSAEKSAAELTPRIGIRQYRRAVGVWIKCGDKDQSMHPSTDIIPRNIANHVFANVTSVEIAQHTEPHLSVMKILPCN
jgi:hypothetical protein